jgi:hypothetical protein
MNISSDAIYYLDKSCHQASTDRMGLRFNYHQAERVAVPQFETGDRLSSMHRSKFTFCKQSVFLHDIAEWAKMSDFGVGAISPKIVI